SSPFLTFLSQMPPQPLRCNLFPYTTLFRSQMTNFTWSRGVSSGMFSSRLRAISFEPGVFRSTTRLTRGSTPEMSRAPEVSSETRSEEHTSELQSRENLVCRLLLEKKNLNNR